MTRDEMGRYVAMPHNAAESPQVAAEEVCPFAEGTPDESEIAREVFDARDGLHPQLGYYEGVYAGWTVEGQFREQGSSGGMVSWLLVELLRRGLVDAVAHVCPSEGGRLFSYRLSRTPEEVKAGAKSRYYPVEMSQVLTEILQTPGRYAVVGIPCFIKGIRLAMRRSPVLRQRVAFTIGLVCGHLKSAAFAEMFAWQCGIAPETLQKIDFRTKLPDREASDYGITVEGDGKKVTRPVTELVGSNWGHGLFKYKGCDYCDDVVGETADVSFGDAWLPEFNSAGGGTNLVLVRSVHIHQLLREGMEKNRLKLSPITPEQAVASQVGAFRHRRDGLAYRLWKCERAGEWHPPKRMTPAVEHLSAHQRRVYDLRTILMERCHKAFLDAKRARNLQVFLRVMDPVMRAYDAQYRRNWWHFLRSFVIIWKNKPWR